VRPTVAVVPQGCTTQCMADSSTSKHATFSVDEATSSKHATSSVVPELRHSKTEVLPGTMSEDERAQLQRAKSAVRIQSIHRGKKTRLMVRIRTGRALEGAWLRAFRYMKLGVPIADTTDFHEVFAIPAPSNATCLERARDLILEFFSNKSVAKVCIFLALCVFVAIAFWGAILVWAMVGLFLSVDNGWAEISEECLRLAASYNQTLGPKDIPEPPDASWGWSRYSPVDHCSANQQFFNMSIKAFTACFSYINLLPIPWRLAIFHHVWLSSRPSRPGVDFYGRPTETMWFQLPAADRKKISVLLNVAYIAHFASQASHIIFYTYVEGQTWPGAFAQNVPFVASIAATVAAGIMQEHAENVQIAAHPDIYPPRLGVFVKAAWRKWRRGEVKGSLLAILRKELAHYKIRCAHAKSQGLEAKGGGMIAGLTGYSKEAISPSAARKPKPATTTLTSGPPMMAPPDMTLTV